MDTPDRSPARPPDGPHRFRRLADVGGEPTAATVELLAPWVIAASRPFADWYFGEPWAAEEMVTEWMSRPSSEVFAGRAVVYEDGGGPGGCIIALPGSELARCRAADFAAFCDEVASEPEADEVIAEIVAVSNELFAPVGDDDFYISRVGVDPHRQGQGIGRAMVSYVLADAARRGHARCRLDVSADNNAAVRAYQAAGLTTVETRHDPTTGFTYCAMVVGL
jgi:ribosomal protein S18 acetylase RimI-like enzyme